MEFGRTKKVILQNLGAAEEHRRRARIVEAYCYRELAHASLAAVSEPSHIFLCSTERDEKSVRELLDATSGICRAGAAGAIFAKYCAELCAARGIEPTLRDMFPHPSEIEPTTVAYVTGGFTDPAFESFRDELSHILHISLRPHHAERVSNACDCVLDGDADFAIIPVWNSRDGHLRSFYRMIDGYDLKILSVTTVPTEEGRTRFALCGADVSPLFPMPAFMEFSIAGDGEIFGSVSDAVAVHGHTVSEVISYPTGQGRTLYHFSVNAGGDLRPTLLYLNLFHPTHTVLGLYGNINEQ